MHITKLAIQKEIEDLRTQLDLAYDEIKHGREFEEHWYTETQRLMKENDALTNQLRIAFDKIATLLDYRGKYVNHSGN